MRALRGVIIFLGLIAIWEAIVLIAGLPPYILPGPWAVLVRGVQDWRLLLDHGLLTATEVVSGLFLGALLGAVAALAMAYIRGIRHWLMPVLVISQAIPVFALAPILVLWLGYGIESKIAMAVIVIFFPVVAAFFDGLRRTDPGWLDLAVTMGGSRWTILSEIRIPAALPALASGLRVATALAPIGAVIGEWVGSSAGLGFLMLHANARVQTDQMFAALFALGLFAVALYYAVDSALRFLLPWQPDAEPGDAFPSNTAFGERS
jgi:putative hydroxymethylpyrimidine transport system permease protein